MLGTSGIAGTAGRASIGFTMQTTGLGTIHLAAASHPQLGNITARYKPGVAVADLGLDVATQIETLRQNNLTNNNTKFPTSVAGSSLIGGYPGEITLDAATGIATVKLWGTAA
ncbi:MAG: hypothetical protein JWO69_537 [Thermoleophilia bacterium]|nr:hypothetical protein [Thermoleophilia bacterium]